MYIGDTSITVRRPVETVIDIDGVIAVLLEVPTGDIDNRNVLAFDAKGSKLWEIEPSPPGTSDDNPFVELTTVDGLLIAETWNGMEYDVDVETGAIEARDFNRF